jgi:hypothetical protein
MDVAEKTLESGKMDFAAAVKLAPKMLTVVAAAHIAQGKKLESVLKRLAEQVGKDQPDAAKLIKLNAEEHEGIRFHVISIPVSMMDEDDREKIAALVGENLDVVIGVGDKSLYVGVGRDAAKTLAQAIEGSAGGEKALPPMEISVAALPIANFVAAAAEGNEKQAAAMIGKVLESSAGKDHLKVTATPQRSPGPPATGRGRLEGLRRHPHDDGWWNGCAPGRQEIALRRE